MSSSSGSEARQRRLFLKVRCTPSEADQFAAAAKAQGKSIAAMVRDALISAERPSPRPRRRQPMADVTELARISGLLGKYGSNLNQIARDANSGGEIVRADEVAQLATEVREVKLLILKALGYGD